jgi:signal peptidase
MNARRALTLTGELALVGVVVALVAGQVLGYPVLLGYVETGSMEPTLDPGDGFVAVPTAVDGDIEEGDVVVFRAENLNGGGLTTHRVVGETDRGYVTRGDANPFTDQDGDEPPVKRAQIVAKALQVNGGVVVVPGVGTAVSGVQQAVAETQRRLAVATGSRSLLGTQGLTYLLFALSVLLYVVDLLIADGRSRDRSRDRDRSTGVSAGLVVAGLAALLVVSASAAMLVPAGSQQYGLVSAEFASENPTVVQQGGATTIEYVAPNGGLVPVVVYLEPGSDGVSVGEDARYVRGGGQATGDVTLSVPDDTGYYRRYVTEHRYLAVLPVPVLDALHRLHPWLAFVAVNATVASVVAVAGAALLRGRRVRVRSRDSRHGRSLLGRVRRLLR